MSELIKLNTNSNDITLSARELHNFLEVTERFNNWFNRQLQYGFEENRDYVGCKVFNTLAKQELLDYEIKLDMAKEIAMIQRSEKGKQARQYFLQVEKAWNSPEMIMKRALEIANKQVENLKLENMEQKKLLDEQKPKVLFADAVSTSHTSILIGDLAKLIKQNGIDIGGRRLFEWLRANGYLIKRKGTDYNMPTQKSMDLGLFEVKETTINHSDGHITTNRTPKVTGKGQQYFINKFLN
ncbi:phage antirepressor KilAC domain-containing protein [Clostridium baratii]|uniref:phage antirepressor KilAC domain-containing protein n=1 Tax=Clostridium baratii TaxID=1561 RepID=UPI00097FB558|nr:phage antirepressor KilAC domain-containing protein [Clostridium baratii]AQM60908.1 oxidoreductase [Clostridium baratii]